MKRSEYMPRTDFADECISEISENSVYRRIEKKMPNMKMNWIEVRSESNSFHKAKGDYISLEFKEMDDAYKRTSISEVLVEILDELTTDITLNKILVAGLGNACMISDAIGPKTVEKIFVTAHLFELNEVEAGIGNCATVEPKVMGQTGLESMLIVKGIVEFYKPDLVIVVDALATNSLARINRVIQVSNTGIVPGSGVGNHRLAINEESLHVPVVSIGVATVTTIGAIVADVLHETKELRHDYLDCIVTPRSMDKEALQLVDIIAMGINCFIHPGYEMM